MRAALSVQSFAGSQLVRGAAGKRLEQVLSSGSDGSLFMLVSDRRVCVADGPGGGGTGGTRTKVRWLDRAGLAAMDIAYSGQGDQLSIGGSEVAPVYLLGEDRQAQALRLAVDVTAAPQGWAEQRGVRLQVRAGGVGWLVDCCWLGWEQAALADRAAECATLRSTATCTLPRHPA